MMVGLIGGMGLPWLYKLTLWAGGAEGAGDGVTPEVILSGARWVGGAVGVLILVTCLVPAVACREAPAMSSAPKISLRQALATTVRNRPFLQMLGMNFFATVGMYSPVTVSLLVSIYFLFHGDQNAAADLTGYLGMAQMLGSLAGLPVNTAVSVRLGKRRAAWVALAVGAAGFASLWWTLLPAHPYWAMVSQVLIGWGMQGVWLMSATMNADVCDSDELATGHRREGVYGAVFSLEQKIAFATAAVVGGYLVSRCGYATGGVPADEVLQQLRATLVVAPLVGLGLAAIFITFYPLSRARVVEIQVALNARRLRRSDS
jgi:Na+/melibiose symporter-like transporter